MLALCSAQFDVDVSASVNTDDVVPSGDIAPEIALSPDVPSGDAAPSFEGRASSSPPPSFPPPKPISVGQNPSLGVVGRALATSALPAWCIAVISVSCVLAVLAGILLVFSIFSQKFAARKTAWVALSVGVIVLSTILIAVSVGVGLSGTTSAGVPPGSRMTLDSAIARVVSVNSTMLWRVVVLDSSGEETVTAYTVQDAGAPVSNTRSGDKTTLPPPNVPLSCTIFVAFDGKVVLESWTLKDAGAVSGRAAALLQVAGAKNVAAYRVKFTGGNCGAPCQEICSSDAIKEMLLSGRQSISKFYNVASQGLFSFAKVDVFDVEVC